MRAKRIERVEKHPPSDDVQLIHATSVSASAGPRPGLVSRSAAA